MSPTLSAAAQALGRALLAFIFILGGWGKINGMAGTIAYITSSGLPFPEVAYYVSVAVEFGGGLAILLGFQTRLVALVMATFCIVTAVVFHYQPGNSGQMINYMKNLAIAGGFLQLFAVGAGAWSVDRLLRR